MTREEAIKKLKGFDLIGSNEDIEFQYALDMAISALYDKERYKEEITTIERDNKTLRVKLENAEDVLRGLKEDLADARAELRERW